MICHFVIYSDVFMDGQSLLGRIFLADRFDSQFLHAVFEI